MAAKSDRTEKHLHNIFSSRNETELIERLSPDHADLPERFPAGSRVSRETLTKRWSRLPDHCDELIESAPQSYQANIENFIGTVKVPVGIAGPLRVNGIFAKGDFLIPLATTEAALVASYHRGSCLLTAAGGCSAALLSEGINRSPAFAFESIKEAGLFVGWVISQVDEFRRLVRANTNYGELIDISTTMEGNHVYLNFEFQTGDAAGQNMITICTEAICESILADSPVPIEKHYVEGNLSGDKKASAQAFTTVRGKKVCAEAVLSAEVVRKFLRTTPKKMVDYWQMSAIGGVLSGTIGVQGHFANGLTALYIACGQDPACVAESAIGVTRFELRDNGDLYAAVTLPGIMVGTVGGGTGLPTQSACLEILGLRGEGKSRALAEVCAGLLLGGELSIIGALASGDFTKAHKRLARQRKESE